MTARQMIDLARALDANTLIPIHYEGWKHFREGREAIERQLEKGPAEVREHVRWLEIGAPEQVVV
jgi:L-ascorbate metabolism protein UlaG (beta-lactamase superfamily)